MQTNNEFIARQIEQSGQLVECIRSGQATAEQVEAHYAAGEVVMLCKEPVQPEPVAWRKANSDGFYRYYEADEDQPAGCEPLYTHAIAQPEQRHA